MKWLFLSIIVGCLLALCGCSPVPPVQGTPPSGEIVLPKAQVKEFLVEPPRSLILAEAINGITQVWLDESGGGGHAENRTQIYSANGCPLTGPPLLPGDAIKVIGQMDAPSGRFVAKTIWMLDVKIEGPCEGPPAE